MDNNQEEIRLIDYIRLARRGKKVIFAWLVAGLLFGAITYVVYQHGASKAPSMYTGEAVIQVGSITNSYLSEQPVENIDGLVWKINSGFYGGPAKLSAAHIPSTMLLDITSTAPAQDQAKNALQNVVSQIVADQNAKIDSYKKNDPQDISDSSYSMVVKQPDASLAAPAKKFSLLLMLIAGGLLGIFVGVFAVLLGDWWKNNKKYIA